MRVDPQVSAGSTPFQGGAAASGPSRERTDGPAALTFTQLRAENAARAARWHPGFPNDGLWLGSDWSNAAAGEMGEACNVVKKLRRQETGGRGAVDPEYVVLLSKLGDEIADTIIYLDLLAAYYGIDTAVAVTTKFNAVSVREGFPERLPVKRSAYRRVKAAVFERDGHTAALVAELGDTSRHMAEEDPVRCSHCKAEKPDRVGLILAETDDLEAEEFGFCSIACMALFVASSATRATAVSPSPVRRSAVSGRSGDSGATREPLASGKLPVAPGRASDGGRA